jgi:hypothetical protein
MTNTTQASAAPAPSSRVTIDDVRTVLEGTDPNQTNASKVRILLGGRGSFETIQKHLSTLRQELATAAAPPVAPDQVPALPAEAAQAMWIAAWTAAQVQTMARAEKLANERDAALLKLEMMGQDIAGLVATVDEQAGQLDQAKIQATIEENKRIADLAELEKSRQEVAQFLASTKDDLERTRSELAKVQSDAVHTAELAESGRELMRQELARLTDQIGELKAALYKRAEFSPAVSDSSPAGK